MGIHTKFHKLFLILVGIYVNYISPLTSINFYCVFTHMYSLLIDKDFRESQNVSIKFVCDLLAYLCLTSGDLFVFPVRVSPFYSYFFVISTSVVSFSTWSLLFLWNNVQLANKILWREIKINYIVPVYLLCRQIKFWQQSLENMDIVTFPDILWQKKSICKRLQLRKNCRG